jgi:hypothetical protein
MSMPKVILFSGWYTRELCEQHRDKLFVFGDNTKRFGMGGQAIIRNQRNSIGIATKRLPAMSKESFFSDKEPAHMLFVLDDIGRVWDRLEAGETVVIPVNDIGKPTLGLERAELPSRAPMIYEAICRHVGEMVEAYGDGLIVDTL